MSSASIAAGLSPPPGATRLADECGTQFRRRGGRAQPGRILVGQGGATDQRNARAAGVRQGPGAGSCNSAAPAGEDDDRLRTDRAMDRFRSRRARQQDAPGPAAVQRAARCPVCPPPPSSSAARAAATAGASTSSTSAKSTSIDLAVTSGHSRAQVRASAPSPARPARPTVTKNPRPPTSRAAWNASRATATSSSPVRRPPRKSGRKPARRDPPPRIGSRAGFYRSAARSARPQRRARHLRRLRFP